MKIFPYPVRHRAQVNAGFCVRAEPLILRAQGMLFVLRRLVRLFVHGGEEVQAVRVGGARVPLEYFDV